MNYVSPSRSDVSHGLFHSKFLLIFLLLHECSRQDFPKSKQIGNSRASHVRPPAPVSVVSPARTVRARADRGMWTAARAVFFAHDLRSRCTVRQRSTQQSLTAVCPVDGCPDHAGQRMNRRQLSVRQTISTAADTPRKRSRSFFRMQSIIRCHVDLRRSDALACRTLTRWLSDENEAFYTAAFVRSATIRYPRSWETPPQMRSDDSCR
jgi:hypothetical protein